MMFRRVFRWVAACAVVALAACGGGGGDAGTPLLGGGTNSTSSSVTAADLVLVLSATSIATNGSETAVATVTAIDANRNVVTGVPVTITVNANGVVTPSGTKTGTAGTLTASIGVGSDRTVRTMTITATSGSLTKTATLDVRDAGGTGSTAADLILTLSASSIANNGTQTVTATATALDAKRNVLSGADVAISVDANAVLVPSASVTDTKGVVTGAIGIGSDTSNRTITVTARSGSLTRTALLQVSNAVVTSSPTASDLSLSLSASSLNNGGTNTITATATAVDVNRNALAGIPITISVDSSAVATVSGSSTNSQGQVTAAVGIGADRSNRVVTVTATSGTLTRSASFAVVGADLKASLSPRVNAGSVGNQIEYTLLDTNALPMVGQTISVTAPGLTSANGKTDINGKYVYTYTAPSANFTVTASAAGATRESSIEVGTGTVDPAPSLPQSASVTPTPSVVSVNATGSTTNQVELRALFYGANNQPIPRVRVRFDLDGNANNTDGTISWLGGTYAYSDASGVARATFTPGQRASPTNGVSVRICYDTSDFDTSTCPSDKQARATLTVTQEALAVNIRTNELIKEGAAKLTYIKEFVVMVVDSAGQAKADILITPSVDLPAYYKGNYQWSGTLNRWVQNVTLANTENYQWDDTNRRWTRGASTTQPQCPNEDANRNGVREAGSVSTTPTLALDDFVSRQEDLSWNGELDPRKSDVAIKMVSSAKTDANGLAVVQIEYGKSLATWVDFVITVTASGVSGTEARARYAGLLYGLGNLPPDADSLTTEKVRPAYVISPYGQSTTCQDAR